MNKKKIAILTYQDRFEKYGDQLRNEFENTEVIQYGSDFSYETLIKRAKIIERLGYEAIVLRGYTCNLIKNHVSLPLVVVEPDMSDLFDSMIRFNLKADDKITFLFHVKNTLLKNKELPSYVEKIFGCCPEIMSYDDMGEYFNRVDDIIMRKRILFSGHNGIHRTAELGGVCSPLYVGVDAMRNAVREAIKIIDIRRKDANQNQKMDTILSNKNEGIINLDSKHRVEWINRYARKTLEIPFNENKEDIDIRSKIPEINWKSIYLSELKNVVVNTENGTKIILDTKIIENSDLEKEAFLFFRRAANIVEEEKKIRAESYKKGQYAKYSLHDVKGDSHAIRVCKEQTKQCAKFDANVLVYGESGVGKEMFAQCIHNESNRKGEPFYAVNCAALPETLLESELFGYSEGSFTGAKKGGKAGIFELAHKGTVFLDEIGELSMASQSALLRVLQEKEVRRIGDDTIIPIDVRVIAASHKDIYREVTERKFREDLFYRLSTVFLTVPPLRARRADILQLMELFVKENSKKYNLKYTGCISNEAQKYLVGYAWKGNVRELQNFVQRIFALGFYEKEIDIDDVKMLLSNSPGDFDFSTKKESIQQVRNHLTAKDIEDALAMAKGNKTEAAKILGISRTHLWRLLNKE